ncbi:MAG TPA: hypothetical protein VJ718_10715, partial [Candidatus Binataceae bacterium]|nr:hypothetical protein [Candidatus Binataceae bacterium]
DHVRPMLRELVQPTLVIHSRQDHTCRFDDNVEFVIGRLGAMDKRVVALEESYHVITVDSEKERVAGETLDFVTQFRRMETARAAGC